MRNLSIIILQHNSPSDTISCLKSLNSAVLSKNTEIVIVNNGGNNANQEIQKYKFPNLSIKYVETKKNGFAYGNNFGLKQTEASNYAFINPDIILKPDTLDILLKYLSKNPKVGIVAPQLIYPNNVIQDNYRVFPKKFDLIIKRTPFLRKLFQNRMKKYLMWNKDPNINEPVDWVTGAFIVVTRKCLKAVGNHDERLFLFMSDLVMCRKAWDLGYEVHLVGEAKAKHNEKRLSCGGFNDIFTNKRLRIHIMDAVKYYLIYFNKRLPKNSPSLRSSKLISKNLKFKK